MPQASQPSAQPRQQANNDPVAAFVEQQVQQQRQRRADAQRNTSALGDLGTATATSFLRVPGMLAGAGDLLTSPLPGDRLVSRASGAIGDALGFRPGLAAEGRDQRLLSRGAVDAQQNISQAEGFGESAAAYLRNPAAIAPLIGSSVGPTVATAALTRGAGAAGAPGSVATRAAVAEGGIGAGAAMQELGDTVPEGRRAAAALATGVATATFARVGGKVAQRYGLGDPEIVLAGGRPTLAAGEVRKKFLPRVLGGAVSEGVLQELPQGVSETIISNWAQGQDLFAGAGRAAVEGIIAGGAMGGMFNVLPGPQEQTAIKPSADTAGSDAPPASPAQGIGDVEVPALIRAYETLNRVAKDAPQHPDLAAEALQRMEMIRTEMVKRGQNPALVNQTLAQREFTQYYEQLKKAESGYLDLVDTDPGKARASLGKQQKLKQQMLALESQYPEIAREPAQEEYNALVERSGEIVSQLNRAKKKSDGRSAALLRDARNANLRRIRELKGQFQFEYTGDARDGEAKRATAARDEVVDTAAEAAQDRAAPKSVAQATLEERFKEGAANTQLFKKDGTLRGGTSPSSPRGYLQKLLDASPRELADERERLEGSTSSAAAWQVEAFEAVTQNDRAEEMAQYEADIIARRETPLTGEELGGIFESVSLTDTQRRRVEEAGFLDSMRGQGAQDLADAEGRDRTTIRASLDAVYGKLVGEVAKSRGIEREQAEALVVDAIGTRPSTRPAGDTTTQSTGEAVVEGAENEVETIALDIAAAREAGASDTELDALEDELSEAEGRALAQEIEGADGEAGVGELLGSQGNATAGELASPTGSLATSAGASVDTSVASMYKGFVGTVTESLQAAVKSASRAIATAATDVERQDATTLRIAAKAQLDQAKADSKAVLDLVAASAEELQALSDDKRSLETAQREVTRWMTTIRDQAIQVRNYVSKGEHQARGVVWGVAANVARDTDTPLLSWAEVGADPRVYSQWTIEINELLSSYGVDNALELITSMREGTDKDKRKLKRQLQTAARNAMRDATDAETGEYVSVEETLQRFNAELESIEGNLSDINQELADARGPVSDALDTFFSDYGISGAAQAAAFDQTEKLQRRVARDVADTVEETEETAELDLDATSEAVEDLSALQGEPPEISGVMPVEDFSSQTEEDAQYTDVERYSWGLRQGDEGQATVASIEEAMDSRFGNVAARRRKVTILQTLAEMQDVIRALELDTILPADVQGFEHNGRYYLVADNIPAGKEFSVLMHEIGVHGGMATLLGDRLFKSLGDQVRGWAFEALDGNTTQEATLAQAAYRRVNAARRALVHSNVEFTEALLNEELIAYFVEEAVAAGIDPTTAGNTPGATEWVRQLWAAFKKAVRKLGIKPDTVTAQEVVDLAHGGARFAMTGSFHGTKFPIFRKFDNAALSPNGLAGIGHYTTEDETTARLYAGFERRAKLAPGGSEGGVMLVDTDITADNTLRFNEALENQSALVQRALEAVRTRHFVEREFSEWRPAERAYEILKNDSGLSQTELSRELNAEGIAAFAVSEYLERAPGDIDAGVALGDDQLVQQGLNRAVSPEMLVVLSDENIYRVSTHVGSDDPQVRFSVGATTQASSRIYEEMNASAGFAMNTLSKSIRKLSYMFSFTQDLADRGEAILQGIRQWHTAVQRRAAERNETDSEVQRVLDPAQKLTRTERAELNKFLGVATTTAKWAFDPVKAGLIDAPADGSAVEVSEKLAARFDALSEPQQVIAVNMFRMAQRLRNDMQAVTRLNLEKLYDEQISRTTDPDRKIAIEEEREATLETLGKDLAALPSYLPLRRFGAYAVVYKSEEMREAFEEGNPKTIEKMKADSKHYRVEFHESHMAAQRRAAEQKEEDGDENVELFERADVEANKEFMPVTVMEGIRQNLEAQQFSLEGNETRQATVLGLQQALNKLYISTLSEQSSRKSELKRIAVAGFNEDMIRSFASYSASMSATIAAMKVNQETQATLQRMSAQARDTNDGLKDQRNELLNEVLTRQRTAMNPRPNPLTEKVMGATSIWMLLSSPAYYLQNATQPFMLSYPWMAARHGAGATWKALTGKYRTVGKAWVPGVTGDLTVINDTTVPDDNHREVLRELQNRGLLDIGIAADLGGFREASGTISTLVSSTHQKMIHAMRTVELFNRGTTALAAFDLELAKVGDVGAAKQYAVAMVEQTQGDYSTANAPSIIERMPLGRIITQFRKFQIIQLSILARTVHGSFRGATEDERGLARRQLLYILGTHAAVGGAMGLPLVNLAAPIVAMALGDEDEPKDMELQLRRLIGDKDTADLLLKGLPTLAGVDVSSRLGMGMATSVLPFTDIEFSRSGAATVIAGLLGPSAGLAQQMADGAGMVMDGNAWLGTAQMMPRGIRDVMRAIAYKTEGVRRRNPTRDVAIDADDVSWFDVFGQGLGWPTQSLTDRHNVSGWLYEMRETFNARSGDIKNEFISGDKVQARKEWRQLQQARREFGLPAQSMSLLTGAAREQQGRERRTSNGVSFNRGEEAFVRSLQ